MELEELMYKKMSHSIDDVKLTKDQSLAYSLITQGKNVFITGQAGVGKCMGFNTPILMHDKTIKMVQDVVEGDLVMGDDFTPRQVSSTTMGIDQMYRVDTDRGHSYVINSEHILTFKMMNAITENNDVIWGHNDGTMKKKHFSSKEEAQLYVDTLPDITDLPLKMCVNRPLYWYTVFRGVYARENQSPLTTIIKITPLGRGDYYGFSVDKNHRFLLANHIITHNSLIIKTFRTQYGHEKNIGITSTTGISAILLGGATLHSYLGIGLGTGSIGSLTTKILRNPFIRKRWNQLSTLIIDEVSMLSPDLFDKLEAVARAVRYDESPFGGIQLILSGDFCQLPVVGEDRFCFEANTWDKCIDHTVYLTDILRQTELDFQTCLSEIRMGKVSSASKKLLTSRCDVKLTNDSGIKPTKLYPTNASVDSFNEDELDALASDGREFKQYIMDITMYGTSMKNREYILEKYKKNCLAPEDLQLCVGAQVMLLFNMDFDKQLVNGSRGVVTGFTDDIPVVKFINGEEVVVDYHIWDIEENDQKLMRMVQIPLKLAWALTIHKCQGATLDYAEVELGTVFEYGQAYCALSRVRNIEGLSINGLDFDRIKAHPKAIDYYENLESD